MGYTSVWSGQWVCLRQCSAVGRRAELVSDNVTDDFDDDQRMQERCRTRDDDTDFSSQRRRRRRLRRPTSTENRGHEGITERRNGAFILARTRDKLVQARGEQKREFLANGYRNRPQPSTRFNSPASSCNSVYLLAVCHPHAGEMGIVLAASVRACLCVQDKTEKMLTTNCCNLVSTCVMPKKSYYLSVIF